MKIRIKESQLEELRKKYDIVNKSDLDNSWSAKDVIRKKEGKSPYIKKGFIFIKLDPKKSIPQDCYYFTDEEASDINQMGHELESLKVSYEEKLKSLSGNKKSKSEYDKNVDSE